MKQNRIFIILFIAVFIIVATSLAILLLNDKTNSGKDAQVINATSSADYHPSPYTDDNSSQRDTKSSSKSEKSKDMKPESTNKKSEIAVTSENDDSKNGEYLPLVIESAKTKQEIVATIDYFRQRLPSLRQTLENSGFYYEEKLLDPNTSTRSFILALNEKYAQNLNGYFYYLIKEKGVSAVVSPFVLNICILFDEEDRESVVGAQTFAEQKHIKALKDSLSAALGKYYSDEVFDFIYSEYKRTFKTRIDGEPLQNPVVKLKISNLEVIFHNSFLTYVEFFII